MLSSSSNSLTAIRDVIITVTRSWKSPFRGHSIITPSLKADSQEICWWMVRSCTLGNPSTRKTNKRKWVKKLLILNLYYLQDCLGFIISVMELMSWLLQWRGSRPCWTIPSEASINNGVNVKDNNRLFHYSTFPLFCLADKLIVAHVCCCTK